MRAKDLFVALAVVGATVVALELGARIWMWAPTAAPGMSPGDRLGNTRYAFAPDVPGDLVPNQDGHWIVWWRRPYNVVTNSLGFRSYEEPKPGHKQIVVLGDSQTFGPYLANDDTWPQWVQAELRRSGALGPLQVHNGAVSGYTIADQLAWLRDKGVALKPDLIVLGVFENDIQDYRRVLSGRATRPGTSDERPPLRVAIDWLRGSFAAHLALYDIAAQLRDTIALRAANVDIARGEGDAALVKPDLSAEFARFAVAYEADFRRFVATARAAGIGLAVVSIPSPSVLAEGMRAEVAPLVARQCAELGVPFLDAHDEFAAHPDPAQSLYLLNWSVELKAYTGNGHMSREGNLTLGKRVAAWLTELNRSAP
jgi:lysophospholipase L1-like esterase